MENLILIIVITIFFVIVSMVGFLIKSLAIIGEINKKIEEIKKEKKTQEEIQESIHKFVFELVEVLSEENNNFVNTFCKVHKYKRISEISYYSASMIKDWIRSKNIELSGKREYIGDILEQIERG